MAKREVAKREALQRQAEAMFIDLGYTAKAISEILGPTEKTIGSWRTKGNWDKRRDELLASPHKLRELLIQEMRSIADGNEPSFDADALSKVSKVAESFRNKVSPQIAITIIKMLDDFLADTNPQLANANLDSHRRFIIHVINTHG